jgi:ABC-2 type transport system ATP-binding protein
MTKKILLQIKNVTKTYPKSSENPEIKALKGVNLDIYEGEVLSLLGVNGAGKTTLSSIISTLHPPTSGEIFYADKSIYKQITDFRQIIGFCPQKPNIDSMLTLKDNLLFAGRYFHLSKDEINKRSAELMKEFNLEKYADAKGSILSGGYKQRFLIARTLMHKPKLVIFDEPTVGLDPHVRRDLWKVIKGLKKEGVTVLLTTHYLDEAENLSDRVCILHKGVIQTIDTPENLKNLHKKSNLEDVFVQLMDEDKDSDSQ